MRCSALFTLVMLNFTFAYSQLIDNRKLLFEEAYNELEGMLKGTEKLSFKRAVFITENAYLDGRLNYEAFNFRIAEYADLCTKISQQHQLLYKESDLKKVEKYASVFRFMTDTVYYVVDDSAYFKTTPFQYDFDDFWGDKNWTKMFVTKLLDTNLGNCHSLPFLYKILCEELGANAYLAMAPNHTYIKLYSKKTGWFNTELTSAYFPIDAWIMASGYIHLSAIQSGIYMDTLSQKQSISVTVIDLAKGYERKFPNDIDFIEKCADLALEYYPIYTNALLLKAEIVKKRFEAIMKKESLSYPSQALNIPEARTLFNEMEKRYYHIHTIGYRMMPKEMYISWLGELKIQRDRYANKELMMNLKSTN
jgi:hypothetical protein